MAVWCLWALILFGWTMPASAREGQPSLGIYGGGPLCAGGEAVLQELKDSGFTTVTAWTLHVSAGGDLAFNDLPLVAGGRYVGDARWPSRLGKLKEGGAVRTLRFAVGSAGVGDFHHIQALLASGGAGPGSVLFETFRALREAFPAADGVDLDDEDLLDGPTTVAFSRMLGALGFQVSFCPYHRMQHWVGCLASLHETDPGLVTAFNLQCYDGGALNAPRDWIRAIARSLPPGFDAAALVHPGLWCRHGRGCAEGTSPPDLRSRFSAWKADGVRSGFLWLYDDLQACRDAQPGLAAADYASAIRQGLGD